MPSLTDHKRIHFVGIKGIGVSALATIAKKMGFEVTGSDVATVFISDILLKEAGIPVKDFAAVNIEGVEAVVHSVAYGEDHVEIAAARRKGLPLYTYPQALGELMAGHTGVSVTGCNGKTTTTSMISYILDASGRDPTFVVGAPISNLGVNAKYGQSGIFVVEADEYREAFLNYAPHSKYVVITNIEWDHPDYYPKFEMMIDAYVRFMNLLPAGARVLVYGQDGGIKQTRRKLTRGDITIKTYGFNETDDYVIKNVEYLPGRNKFEVFAGSQSLGKYELIIPGDHNILNATAAIVHCLDLGVSKREIGRTLAEFRGANRRFEVKGEVDGITVIDDYAHHPTAVRVTLAAARQFYPDSRLWCVFQPHTFSRTKSLLNEFARSFSQADIVIIPEIYPSARETDDGSVSSKDLVKLVSAAHPNVRFTPTTPEVVDILEQEAQPGDVVMVMGAGDIWRRVAEAFLPVLRRRLLRKLGVDECE